MKVSCDPETNRFPPWSDARQDTASKWPSSVSRLSMPLRSMTSMPVDDVAAARKSPITTMSRTGMCCPSRFNIYIYVYSCGHRTSMYVNRYEHNILTLKKINNKNIVCFLKNESFAKGGAVVV